MKRLLIPLLLSVAGPLAAGPVTSAVAEAALFPPKGAQAVILRSPGLSAADVEALRQVAATQKYYGAIAISPDEGLMAAPTLAATNYHDVQNARAAALATCNDKRKKGAARCVVVADIVPINWTKGAKIQLSTDATAAVESSAAPRHLAISPTTGDWGQGANPSAAVAACAAKKAAKDCAIAISD